LSVLESGEVLVSQRRTLFERLLPLNCQNKCGISLVRFPVIVCLMKKSTPRSHVHCRFSWHEVTTATIVQGIEWYWRRVTRTSTDLDRLIIQSKIYSSLGEVKWEEEGEREREREHHVHSCLTLSFLLFQSLIELFCQDSWDRVTDTVYSWKEEEEKMEETRDKTRRRMSSSDVERSLIPRRRWSATVLFPFYRQERTKSKREDERDKR
jgi:hypothetical protein